MSDDFNWQTDDLYAIPEHVRQGMRRRALAETYYLATMVLGYDKLTPFTHGPLCTFLDTCGARRRMIQMPRSHFKTTITTVTHKIRLLLNDPTLRMLLVGDTAINAQKHLGKIRLHFEANRMLRWLFPERIWDDFSHAPAWSRDQIYLPNDAPHGEPTIDTIGARGAAVSRHYDIITADDIIGEDEYFSNAEMSKTIDWFTGLESLFAPPIDRCLLDMPSTHWRTDDVYAFAEKFYGHGQEAVKTGPYSYQRGELAVFRRGNIEDGKPIFPEGGFTMEFYERLREQNPERYAAQYANNPFDSDVAYFRKEYLRYYDVLCDDGQLFVLSVTDDNGNRVVIKPEYMEIYSFCDPAAGGVSRIAASKAAVITTGVSKVSGKVFVLDCWLKRAPTDQIIDEVLRQNEKWMPQVFSIEGNGLQKMLKFWLDERVLKEGRISVPYRAYIPKGDKDGERRIRGLQPLFRAGQVYFARGMHALIDEYLAYPHGGKDGLDALSQGLEYWSVGWDSVEQEVDTYEEMLRRARSRVTGY